ncbi:MAG: hypothetical protein ACI4XE_04750 [Acutalibacteraceae bacterium]
MAVTTEEKRCQIENETICLELAVAKKRISSSSVTNKITGNTLSGQNGSAEFTVQFKNGLFGQTVSGSELKINSTYTETENKTEKLIIEFEPFKIKGDKISLTLIYSLEENKPYFRKQLVFSAEPGSCRKAVIDHIDMQPLVLSQDNKTWCVPKQEKAHMNGFAVSLGQPVFVDDLYFGCEFPACVNTIENGAVTLQYYSGKSLCELMGESGVYKSVKSVCGAADTPSNARVKAAFFEYIKDIARPTGLRMQYNSWYDHMLNIDAKNIEHSFYEIEKAMTAVGSKPLNCYVVDDGWNDYKKDFWCFNSKFPNELYPARNLSEAFGSSFGLWLGPRGGYTLDTVKFARQIQKGGNGYLNKRAQDVDVASKKYIDKTADFMSDCQSRFNLTYWKLDGFSLRPCRSKSHDHICGGKNDMYYYSEMWERWIEVFARLIKESDGKVYINLTSYSPPSPWFLQWVNAVWIQTSNDIGMIEKDENGKKLTCSQKDKLLSYRDERYYDFYRVRELCFPASNLYNHDPIYGNEAKISLSDDEFREYLFTMAARGTSFWELYYSFNMMNEAKWRINNAVLRFVEEEFGNLRNSVLFGGKPSLGQVYGFGCFDGDEGIVALRNAGSKDETYVLRLEHSIGADERLQNAAMTVLLPYSTNGAKDNFSFGDTVTVKLPAYQTKILHFGKKAKPLEAVYVKALDSKTLEVMFNQSVIADEIKCDENEIVSASLLEDYRSVRLSFKYDFPVHDKLTLRSVKDLLLNKTDLSVSFDYHENNVIVSDAVEGNTDFSIVATTGGDNTDKELFSQGDEICLEIKNGRFVFTVCGQSVVSVLAADGIVQVCAVRERNGVLKLYLDKKLDSGSYDGCAPANLTQKAVHSFDKAKIKLYSKALSYDEV